MGSLIELNLKKEALQKRLDLVNYQINEKESAANKNCNTVYNEDGIYFNKEDLHKLLCLLERTIVPKEEDEKDNYRSKLLDYKEDLSWDIADKLGYDLNEGNIDQNDYTFRLYKDMK